MSIDNDFLSKLKSNKRSVFVYLVNGIKLHGVIEDFDDKSVLLKSSALQIVYKQSISSIMPSNEELRDHIKR